MKGTHAPRSAVNFFNDILLIAHNLLSYVRKALGFDEESGYKKQLKREDNTKHL